MHYGWGMGSMGLMWIFWIAVVAVLFWGFSRLGTGPSGGSETPEAALKRRYARGEVSRDEYERMLADLRR